MEWEEACKRSDSSVAVRIDENGRKIHRNIFGVWYFDSEFTGIYLEEKTAEGFLDWKPF